MLTRIFLSVVFLSVTGSVGYLLLKMASAIGSDHLSENWRYRGGMAVSLLFVLPLHKLWAAIPQLHSSQLAILMVRSVFLVTTSEQTTRTITSGTRGGVEATIDWSLVRDWAAVLWLVVAVILTLKTASSFLRCQWAFKRIGTEVDGHLYQLVLETAETAQIHGMVRLQVSPLVQSPMLIGYLHPTIVLPSKEIPDKDVQLILAHELTHFRRKDQWKKLMLLLIQCIHWFNPVVYLLSRDCVYWMETSCDECIVSSMHHDQRKAYGLILIGYAPTSRQRVSNVYVSFAPSQYKLKRRISILMNFNKKSRSILGLILALVIAMGCVATTAFAVQSDTDFAGSFSTAEEEQCLINETVIDVPVNAFNTAEEEQCPIDETVIDVPVNALNATEEEQCLIDDTLTDMGIMPLANGELAAGSGFTFGSVTIGAGQTLTVSATYTPSDGTMRIGYKDSNNIITCVTISGGSGFHTFKINKSGTYKIYIYNPSKFDLQYDVSYITT